MEYLHVFAFGQLRMHYREQVVTSFPTRHVAELFGYLLLNQQVAHNREKLTDILWPQTGTAQARARFSTVLWRLRGLFNELGLTADDFMQVTRQSLRFTPGAALRFDLLDFEQLVSASGRTEDMAQRESLLVSALDQYRGELFEGLYSDWCLRERERVARLHLRALGQLMACLMRREAYEEAAAVGNDLLAEDPLREEVHRALMYCYWQTDQRARAVNQYLQCADHLMDEIQVLPMTTTMDLYQRILADRLRVAQTNGATQTRQETLAQAYAEFQKAGKRLAELLDAVEAEEW